MPTLDDLKKLEMQSVSESEQVQTEATVAETATVETAENVTPAEQNTETNQPTPQELPTVAESNLPAESEQPNAGAYSNEQLAEADAYIKRTGKTLEDYLNLKRPTESISEDELLKNYLTAKEGKTKTEAEIELRKLKVDEPSDDDFDDFDDEDNELKKLERQAQIEKREALLEKARSFRDEQVQAELGASATPQNVQPTYEDVMKQWQEQAEKANQQYLTDVYTALPNLKGITLNVEGEDVIFPIDDDFRNEVKATTENLTSVANQYFDPNGSGKLINAEGLMSELSAWANPKTRNAMLKFFANQIEQRVLARTDASQRNITLSQRNEVSDGKAVTDEQLALEWLKANRKSAFGL